MCRRYDQKTDSIVLGNACSSWAYTRESYRQAGIGTATDAIFEFANSLAKLKVDTSEFALLTAVTVFSGGFLCFLLDFDRVCFNVTNLQSNVATLVEIFS